MSEPFRQQLATTGLQDSAELLSHLLVSLQRLTGQIANAIQPLTSQYAGIAETTSQEIEKLRGASARLQQHNSELIAQAREESWLFKGMFCFLLLLVGFIIGLSLEKTNTNNTVADIDARVDQILQKMPAQPPIEAIPPSRARGKK